MPSRDVWKKPDQRADAPAHAEVAVGERHAPAAGGAANAPRPGLVVGRLAPGLAWRAEAYGHKVSRSLDGAAGWNCRHTRRMCRAELKPARSATCSMPRSVRAIRS